MAAVWAAIRARARKRVHHRALGVPVGRVRDQARGLVDREQVIVFEQHVEPDVFGRHRTVERRVRVFGKRDGHDIAERRACGDTADGRAVHGDLAVLDPCLDAGSRRLVGG